MNFYWLKNVIDYTEIILIIIFVTYLISKHNKNHIIIKLIISFLILKLIIEIYSFLNYTDWLTDKFPFLIENKLIIPFFELLYSPILFFLALACINKEFALRRKHLIHFINSGIYIVLFFFFFGLVESNLTTVFTVVRLQFLIYVILSIYQLSRHNRNSIPRGLFYMYYGFLLWNLFWSLEFYGWYFFSLFSKRIAWYIYIISEVVFLISLIVFFYSIIKNSKLWPKYIKKYRVLLSKTKIESIENKIQHAMDVQKVYRNPEMNLRALSELIKIASNDITLYLNSIMNKNFSKFISQYRIEESKDLLKSCSSRDKTIEIIMFEVGFNSKSAFYTAFKNETGLTPKEYRKKEFKDLT